jgi:outer membrane protein
MKSITFVAAVTAAVAQSLTAHAQTAPRVLTLDDVVTMASRNGDAVVMAGQTLEIAQLNATAFEARLRPQLSLSGEAIGFQRSINPLNQPNGETFFVPQAQNQSSIGFGLSKQILRTGGELSVSSQLNRIDLFGNRTGQSWNSTPVFVTYTQNLFRPQPLLWQLKTQPVTLALAERQFIEAREDAVTQAVGAFFDLNTADITLRNAVVSAAVSDTIFRINRAKYDNGSITDLDLSQSELALMRANVAVENARAARIEREATLRRLLKITDAQPLATSAPPLMRLAPISPDSVVKFAIENGSSNEQAELDAISNERLIKDAILNKGFSARVSASVGFNQTAPGLVDAYQSPLGKQRLSVSVSMPLSQGGAGDADVAAGRVSQSRNEVSVSARRALVAEQARSVALRFAQAQATLGIMARTDSIATRQLTQARANYARGSASLTDLLRAQSDKDAQQAQVAESIRAYWLAYYQMRRIALYDFAAGRPIDR